MSIHPSILEKNLSAFFVNAGFTKAVIGVSGGVDSAVTLAIATNALGKENVYALLMPYKIGIFSSNESLADAKAVCEQFEVCYEVISIDAIAQCYEERFSNIAFANTLARIRMTLLFGTANTQNALVLGTCNKTETLLGYETKFGDGACDVSVIGNLWKHEVYDFSRHYNIPYSIQKKKPSAELWPGQTDEEEMGFSYELADSILKKIENGEHAFSTPKEQKIYLLYKSSAHKRNPIPTLPIDITL